MDTRTCPRCGSTNIVQDAFQIKCMDCGYQKKNPMQ